MEQSNNIILNQTWHANNVMKIWCLKCKITYNEINVSNQIKKSKQGYKVMNWIWPKIKWFFVSGCEKQMCTKKLPCSVKMETFWNWFESETET